MVQLWKKRCLACEGAAPKLAPREVAAYRRQLDRRWEVARGRRLRREFAFQDFGGALRFADAVGAIAEVEWHHPQITLGWGRVVVEIWTHAVGALTVNDFILAAKIDRLGAARPKRRGRRGA